jgi:MFS transporter, ACDE family, multidrug resistance protein
MAIRPPIRRPFPTEPGKTSIAGLYALENMSRAVIGPVIALEGMRILGDAQQLSVILFVGSIFSMAIMLSSGWFIRKFSRKFVFTAASVMAVVAAFFYVQENALSFGIATALRTAGAGLVMAVVSLYIMDFIPSEDLPKAEARKILMAASTWICFPIIGVWLWSNSSHSSPFVVSGFAAVLMFLFFWYLRVKEADAIQVPNAKSLNIFQSLRKYFSNRNLTIAYLISFVRATFWYMLFTYSPVYIVHAGLHESWSGIFVGVITSVLLLSDYFARIGQRFGIRRSIRFSFFLGGICLTAIGLLPEPTVYALIFWFVASLTADMLDVVGNLPFMRIVDEDERVEMTMVFATCREMAVTVTPGIGALILFFFPIEALFIFWGLLFLAVGSVVMKLPRHVD